MKSFFSIVFSLILVQLYSQNYNLTKRSSVVYPGQVLANVWTYAANGREYALVGASKGMSIVDVTDPDNPKQIKQLLDGIDNSWREIKTYKNFAYITTEGGGGIAIADLTNLPDTTIPFHKYTGDKEIAGQLGRIHALQVDTTKGFVYCYGTTGVANGGAVILDLNVDPFNPTYAGMYNINYIHDGFADNDTLYGAHIYQGYFSIIDCKDKKNPKVIRITQTPTNFTHNTWLDNSKKYCFTTDENTSSFLGAFDISNVDNITLLDKIQPTPGSGSIVHNTYIRGNFAITSWYKDGFTITDISRPQNLIQVGHYDLYPQGAGNGFEGTWGVAPYLPSGNIICSNIRESVNNQNAGVMYVMTPEYLRAAYLEGKVTIKGTNTAINNATIDITNGDPLSNTNTDIFGEYKTGQYSIGKFDVTYSKFGFRSKTIQVEFKRGEVINLNVELESLGEISLNTIENANNNPLPNCQVKLSNSNGNYVGKTDNAGNLKIDAFEDGDYEVIVGSWGFDYFYNPKMSIKNGDILKFKLDRKYRDDFVFDYNWLVSGSAPRGKWVKGVPIQTIYQNAIINTGNDVNTDIGSECYVTGNGGGNPQDDDVDDGETILTSPSMDLSTFVNPVINYKTWFFDGGPFQSPNDSMKISITNGLQTVDLEIITKSESSWKTQSSIKLNGLIPLTKDMKIIVNVADINPGHWVEGAFDEFSVTEGTSSNFDLNQIVFSISPNPTINYFTVNYQINQLQKPAIQINSIDGKLLKTILLDKYASELNFGQDLESGMYLISLLDNQNKIKTVKVIKN